MAGAGRMPDRALADLLHRLSIAVAAGVDLRRAWAAEVGRVPARWRPALARTSERLNAGDGLGTAAAASHGAIPDAVAGMLCVGDRTGRIAEVLEQASATLARSIATRRALLAALVGPVIRLVAAAIAAAVLLVVSAGAGSAAPVLLDLGHGSSRTVLVALLATACLLGAGAACSGWSWRSHGWAGRLGRRLPVVGPAARAAAAAAWCRAASLAAHAGIGVGEQIELASRAAATVRCDRRRVEELLRGGRDLAEALALASDLPRMVIEAVAVGEMTGTTAEALDRVADQLDDAARRGVAAAVQAVGFVAWVLVACLVAAIVIHVASTYARMIHDLTRPR